MTNKRGWLRIIEATIAILIILSSFLVLYSTQKLDIQNEPNNQVLPALEYVVNNNTLRNEILNNDSSLMFDLEGAINNHIDLNKINYTLKICSLIDNCDPNISEFSGKNNIYSLEKVVMINLTNPDLTNAKRVRIFYWEIH